MTFSPLGIRNPLRRKAHWLSRASGIGIAASLTLPTSAPAQSTSAPAEPATTTEPATAEADAKATPPLFEIHDGQLFFARDGKTFPFPLPAPAKALHIVGKRVYVAIGEQGVALVALDAKGDTVVEKLIPISHGQVTGFITDGNGIWMKVDSAHAIRLHGAANTSPPAPITPVEATPVAAPAKPTPKAPAPPRPAGPSRAAVKIAKIFNGQVLLDAGKNAGLRAGDRFRVVRGEQISDEGGAFDGEREVGVLVVDSVSPTAARARIWRGDRVLPGDRLEPANKKTDASLVYPRQLFGFVETEVHVRPILNVGETGFGTIVDANATYYAEDYYVGLRSQPFGIGRTGGRTAFTQTLLAEGGYNSRPFAIGLGVGLTSVFGDLSDMFEITSISDDEFGLARRDETQSGPQWEESTQELQHAFALNQRVRLGAMDGLNLTVANTLLYFSGSDANEPNEEHDGFTYAGTNAKLTIPLAQRADLFLEGGGGVSGYAFGAIGVFGWIRGNGGPGSLGMLASAGGAGVWSSVSRTNVWYGYTEEKQIQVGGPMVSAGVRYRFGLEDRRAAR
ncbi:MAG: hypothetical protein HRU17_11875 [Polyangiaceae bacterium]|nr:hypothetical protein [Polyangiaceae bacterium]